MSERRFSQDEVYALRNAVGKAFAALRKQGFIARVNLSCCTPQLVGVGNDMCPGTVTG